MIYLIALLMIPTFIGGALFGQRLLTIEHDRQKRHITNVFLPIFEMSVRRIVAAEQRDASPDEIRTIMNEERDTLHAILPNWL